MEVFRLYTKGLIFRAFIDFVMSFTVSEWLKALLASSMLIELALLGVRS